MLDEPYCERFHRAIELIGRRWTGAILVALLAGRTRFGEIRGAVPGLADRMLCERLRELEDNGLVHRIVDPSGAYAGYEPTPHGVAFQAVVEAISAWAQGFAVNGPDRPSQASATGGSTVTKRAPAASNATSNATSTAMPTA